MTKFVDFQEFRPTGAGFFARASKEGVRVAAVQVDRMLGHEQARNMGRMLMDAADEAEKRGCQPVLMEK